MDFHPSDLDPIVNKSASQYGLDSNWIRAIIMQESGWNFYAVRYEPTYRYLLTPDLYAKGLGISVQTETICQQMSWGLGQLMGALCRELHFYDEMGKLFLPKNNIPLIAKNMANIRKSTGSSIDDMFAAYNGGLGAVKKVDGKYLNQSYVDSVKKHLQFYQAGS